MMRILQFGWFVVGLISFMELGFLRNSETTCVVKLDFYTNFYYSVFSTIGCVSVAYTFLVGICYITSTHQHSKKENLKLAEEVKAKKVCGNRARNTHHDVIRGMPPWQRFAAWSQSTCWRISRFLNTARASRCDFSLIVPIFHRFFIAFPLSFRRLSTQTPRNSSWTWLHQRCNCTITWVRTQNPTICPWFGSKLWIHDKTLQFAPDLGLNYGYILTGAGKGHVIKKENDPKVSFTVHIILCLHLIIYTL